MRLNTQMKSTFLKPAYDWFAMAYFLPSQKQHNLAFSSAAKPLVRAGLRVIPLESSSIPPELSALPPESSAITHEQPDLNLYVEWSQLPPALQLELENITLAVSKQKRVSPDLLKTTILALRAGRYMGRRVLAHLLNRNYDDLMKRTLAPLVESGQLQPAFPSSSNPKQAYMTKPHTID